MITKIIHIADLHLRNLKMHEQYTQVLNQFIDECKTIIEENTEGETLIVIAGDVTHEKLNVSNEKNIFLSSFLRKLNKLPNNTNTLIIAGNHDYAEGVDRIDTLTPVIKMLELENVKYLDMELDYKSGCIMYDNIIFALYSIFEGYKRPDIDQLKIDYPDKTIIGLFHGAIIGSSTDAGLQMESGISPEIFLGCDFVICGDIHKYQNLRYKGIPIVYSSSLIQQNFGENISNHGYVIWDIQNKTHILNHIESEYGFYKFKVKSLEDIELNHEKLLNL